MRKIAFTAISFCAVHSVAQPPALGDSRCDIKVKNAASFELAQTLALPVQQMVVSIAGPGRWTEMFSHNQGYFVIKVKANDYERSYKIEVQQLGSSRDCEITNVIDDHKQGPS